MVLESAKSYATVFAEQKVSDAVILCPAHFNQAERRALKRSAELAGIKVLQLMNNHAAGECKYKYYIGRVGTYLCYFLLQIRISNR